MTASPTMAEEPMAPAHDDPARPARGFPVRTVVPLALAWLVPAVTYLLGIAAVVPVIVLVATASLLRGGRSLLDRLVLALGVLFGATCGGALIFTVWPFGMHPVAVGGTALTGLVVIALVTKRRPTLPRVTMADVLTLGATAGVAAFAAVPLLRRSEAGRLAIVVVGDDMSRHLSLFDGIRQLGGYAFERWEDAHALMYEGMVTYPQGQHMLTALLDGFWRSSTAAHRSDLSMMDHYLASQVLGYVMLALTMVWAAQWIAAPVLTPLRRIVLVGAVTTFTVVGDLPGNLTLLYGPTVLGLALMALLLAVLLRGVASTRQQMVTIGSLVVAVGFTYYLFLPAALLAVAFWLVVNRRRVLRHRVAAAVTTVVSAPVALLPVALGVLIAAQATQLTSSGELVRPSRDHLIALAALVAVSVLFTRARRSPIWRTYLGFLVACLIPAGALFAYGAAHPGGNGYYPNKTLHLVLMVLLVGVGVLFYHLPTPRRERDPRRAWLRAVAPGAAAALVLAGGVGLIRDDAPYTGKVWMERWRQGARGNNANATAIKSVLDAGQPPAGTAVIVYDSDPVVAYVQTLFIAAFQGTTGRVAPGVYLGEPLESPDRLGKQIQRLADPIRIVVRTDEAEVRVQQVLARYPGRHVEVVRIGS